MPNEKSIQEYRRDIFALKLKLKDEQKYLQQIKQKYSQVDIFGQEKSYTFNLKLKILQQNLASIKQNMEKYIKDQAYDIYALNFATLALLKSTQIMMINKEMIFRAIDIKYQGKVKAFEFNKFLKETLRLTDQLIKIIIEALDPQNKGILTKQRYTKYIQCFLINQEQENKQIRTIDIACDNIVKHIIIFNNTNPTATIQPEYIWKPQQINIAIFSHGLIRKITTIDKLDCIALYCKLDPMKKGYIETKDAVLYLKNKINDMKAFGQGTIKLQK